MAFGQLFDALFYGNAQHNRLIKLGTPLGDDWLVPLQAKGKSRLGRDYEFVVDVASSQGDRIDLKALIGQPVTLWLQQSDASYLPHHGYVKTFSRLGSDGYLTFYQLRFSSWMCFLPLRRDMRDWQEQTGEQIVADVVDEHPQAQGAYRFDLRQAMPQYSNRVQWEDDWNFVHRSLEEAGVFGRFEQAKDGKSHMLVLMDDLYFAPQLEQKTVRFIRTGLREEVDGFTQWKEQQQIQSARLTTRTFDYKRPDLPKQVDSAISARDDVPAQGEVYDYTGAYSWGVRDRGEHRNAMRVEAWESQMKRFHAIGSLRSAMPGYWFTLQGHPIHDKEPEQDREFAILETTWTIRNNLPGMDEVADFAESLQPDVLAAARANAGGVKVRHPDGSEGYFQVEIEAQRRRAPFRSPFEHRKPVLALQTAIVAGPDSEEIYTDSLNRVKVWFPWNRRNEGDEKASVWVRSAFPDAGSKRGGHFPLRKGDEVVVGFMGGDCDRPVILGRMHGGPTPPVWHTNGLLSGYRSKEYGGSGFNQLVMDDATGQNRIHLYSTSADSHLHLGYLVDHTGNTRGDYLGSGFDLKSNAYGAIRAEQGLVLSSHPASTKQPLDVRQASSQLVNAESVIDALSNAGAAHRAESLKDGYDALKAFTDATQKSVAGSAADGGRTAGGGTGNANGFAEPIMLMTSPSGIALSTQQSTHVSAEKHVNVVSGASTHIASGKSLIASVGEKLSLFVQNAGMKLFAAKGKIQVQAQSDAIELTAHQGVKVVSATQAVDVAGKSEILLTSGGAYIRIKDGNIEIHAPGRVDVKGAQRAFAGPVSQDYPLPQLPTGDLVGKYSARFAAVGSDALLADSRWLGQAFKITDDEHNVLAQGTIGEDGRLPRVTTDEPRPLRLEIGADDWKVQEVPRAAALPDTEDGQALLDEEQSLGDYAEVLDQEGGAFFHPEDVRALLSDAVLGQIASLEE
ncbi:type VI secretion system Vgr family protein [Trinickia soli]|uniref:type VI secretion system Vgr family protein n=1 Tax=Trinickia soli TaxID=380675 RepID=UPI003FA343AE